MRNDLKLAAFCVQRRAIAAAIFIGTHLGFSDVKQLDSDQLKAEAGAIGFVNWILTNFAIDSVVIEEFEGSDDLMRAGVHKEVERVLRSYDASIQVIRTPEFVAAFGYLGKGSRKEARETTATIWPILDAKRAHPAKLDAVALGLYTQTDRLLQ